MTDCCVAILVW